MFQNRGRSKLSWVRCSAVVLAQIAASGCGSGVSTVPTAVAGTVAPLSADYPSCAPATSAAPPASQAANFHLANGSADRDRLFMAVVQDDSGTLTNLLAAGADANSARARGFTVGIDGTVAFAADSSGEAVSLLHWAATLSNSGDTIRILIAHGANVHAKDSNGRTVLMEAAQNPGLAPGGIQALLDAGADVHERDHDQKDALMYAASSLDTDHGALCLMSQKLPVLQHAGADINENITYTPLMAALYSRNLGMAKLVRALGGSPRLRATLDGSTALHRVARAADDNIDAVKWLLARGIDRHVRDNAHLTALDLFKENLSAGHCHATDPARPTVNLCASGTQAIIKAISSTHRR